MRQRRRRTTMTGTIPLNVEVGGKTFADSFAMDVKRSHDGAILYAADVTNFRVVVIDTAQRKVVGSVDVGAIPMRWLSSGKHVYVANIGVFAYSPIPNPPARSSGETIDQARSDLSAVRLSESRRRATA